MVCQKKHWKVGGHRAECATLAAAAAGVAFKEMTEGDNESIAEGKEKETDGSGRKQKKKGGKKRKKERR